MKTRNFKTMLTAIALTIAAPLAMAADSATPTNHNPYTVLGVQLRSVLLADSANGSSGVSLGPAIFQEIVPCRFISTLEADRYPIEWGGPAYAANESRSYRPTGEMVSANFTNPCSMQIPVESLAVAARVFATGTKSTKSVGNTVVWLTPGHDLAPADKLSKIALIPGEQSMNEASVVLKDKMFTVTSQAGGADLVIDIIGYFIADPYLNGAQGVRPVRLVPLARRVSRVRRASRASRATMARPEPKARPAPRARRATAVSRASRATRATRDRRASKGSRALRAAAPGSPVCTAWARATTRWWSTARRFTRTARSW